MYAENPIDLDDLTRALQKLVPSIPMDDTIMSPFSPEEILRRLSSMTNAAPGKDKLEYAHLKLITLCHIITPHHQPLPPCFPYPRSVERSNDHPNP